MKDLQERKFKPVYLLAGDEPYYIDAIADYIAVVADGKIVNYGKGEDILPTLIDGGIKPHCPMGSSVRFK